MVAPDQNKSVGEYTVRMSFDTEKIRDQLERVKQRVVDLDRAVKKLNEVAPVELSVKVEVDTEW
jgi:hypothetical protein